MYTTAATLGNQQAPCEIEVDDGWHRVQALLKAKQDLTTANQPNVLPAYVGNLRYISLRLTLCLSLSSHTRTQTR